MLLYLSVHKQTWERAINILLKKADKCFIVNKEIMNKNSQGEKWELPEISLDVNKNGNAASISSISKKSHDTK